MSIRLAIPILFIGLLAAGAAAGEVPGEAVVAATEPTEDAEPEPKPELTKPTICGLIDQAAARYRLPVDFFTRLIWKESRFDPAAVGTKDEIGLMQITEAAAAEWALAARHPMPSRTDLFDPAMNADVGAWYLARAVRRWSGRADDPRPFALAEYNAGRTAVERWAVTAPRAREFMDRIPYPTTRRYVHDILARYRGRG